MSVEEPPAAPAITYPYAGFWRRFTAFVIDILLIAGAGFALADAHKSIYPVLPPFWWAWGGSRDVAVSIVDRMAPVLIPVLIWWLYSAGLESSRLQATIGKRLCGLVVVDSRGRRINFAVASVRFVGKIVSAALLGAGFIMIGVTAKKQGIHDLMAATLVLDKAADC